MLRELMPGAVLSTEIVGRAELELAARQGALKSLLESAYTSALRPVRFD